MSRFWAVAAVFLIIVLAAFNLLLIKQNGSLQARLSESTASFANPPDKALLRLHSVPSSIGQLILKNKTEKGNHPPLSLLIFLNRRDCGACLEEAEVWEKLFKQFSPKGFFVLGIIRESDTLWADQLSKDYELTFPIASLDSTTLEYLGVPPVTPFKVMVDSLHRVVWLSEPSSEPEEQKNFAEVAEKLCRAYLTN